MLRKTRFAPTPSGYLHPGNALSFLLTWTIARHAGARILLRIDDLDRKRYRREYLQDIFETIEWLGLDYDEGPVGVEDFEKNWSQLLRVEAYREAVDQLGHHAETYGCSCTRRDIRQHAFDHRYPGTCRHKDLPRLPTGMAWRLHVPTEATISYRDFTGWPHFLQPAQLLGDVVIHQKDGFPSYQIASLVDDRIFEVDLILRGEDLMPSTAVQLFIASLLGWNTFLEASFWHHPLVLGNRGVKLSKSQGATSLLSWRERGQAPAELVGLAAEFLKLPEKPGDAASLLGLYRQHKEA